PVVTAAQGQHPAEDPEESRAVAAERPAPASPVAGRPVAPAALAVAGTALLAAVVTALVRARRG
ncbi:MFS transporter, partial [Micrococcus luteus]|nr:MFS transporter [Micrococcus luteus]